MAVKIRYHDSDKLEVFLSSISNDAYAVKQQTLKRSGETIKQEVIKALPRSSKEVDQAFYGGKYQYKTHIHMQDDVKVVMDMNGLYGDQVKVRGGRATGTLWHLVNDGTSEAKPTHFMDKAQDAAEPLIDKILEDEMGAVFG